MFGTRVWGTLAGAAVVGAAAIGWAQAPRWRIGAVQVPALSTRSLDAAHFKALHAAVAPKGEGERWAEIPWEADLGAARQKAARDGKPLVLWLMDGHPLGCT